jgi:hypothetical protein
VHPNQLTIGEEHEPWRYVSWGSIPGTDGDHCPAVFVEEENGDLLFQGSVVTDASTLAEMAGYSPTAGYESVVRLPARMQQIVLEAVRGVGRSAI